MNHYELDLYLEVVYFCREKRDRESVFKIHELVAWFVFSGQLGGSSGWWPPVLFPQEKIVAGAEHSTGECQPDGETDPDAFNAPAERETAKVRGGQGDHEVADERDDGHGGDVRYASQGVGVNDLQGVPELVKDKNDD